MNGFFFGENQGTCDGYYQDAQYDEEGSGGRYVDMEELVPDHLQSDKAQKYAQAVFQQPEFVGYVAQQEEQGPQSHNGENIGKEYDERVRSDREDGRNGIDGKDDVGELNDEQNQKERSNVVLSVNFAEEIVTFQIRGDAEVLGGEFYNRMVRCVDFIIAFVFKHLDTREDEDDTENGENPGEALHNGTQREDEDETHHDGSQNAPE